MLKGHTESIVSIAFSPDGSLVASSGSFDQTVRLWDVKSGREQAVLKEYSTTEGGITFSPSGNLLACCSDNNTVSLWEVPSGRKLIVSPKHSNPITSIAFSPNGDFLAYGCLDGSVRVWSQLRRMTKAERARIEKEQREQREREEQARREQERQERREQERRQRKRKEQQRQAWRLSGCCEECGTKLGFWNKLIGRTRCNQHR